MIYILSGPIHSGKTTAVENWAEGRKDVGGFISPDIDGLRYITDLKSSLQSDFQVSSDRENDVINVGPYTFLESGFKLGIDLIHAHLRDPDIDYIVIDELGKLELRGNGFASLIPLIKTHQDAKHFILIIRDSLLNAMIKELGIRNWIKIKFEGGPPGSEITL